VTGFPSSLRSPQSPNPPFSNDPNYEAYKHGQQFMIVDKQLTGFQNDEYLVPAKAKEAQSQSQLPDFELPKKK
jgi:hypothetical protein